jgi:hypothetical protein
MTLLETVFVAAAAIVVFTCGFLCGARKSHAKSEPVPASQQITDHASLRRW